MTRAADLVLAGAVTAILAVGGAAIVAVGQRRLDREPHFRCSDGSRMYVDSVHGRYRIDDGLWVTATAHDHAYYVAYMLCDPDIRP